MPYRLLRSSLVLFALVAAGVCGTAHAQKAAEKKPVTLKVLLPLANAVLTVEGKDTKQLGTTRTFESPLLEPGKKYEYTLVAVLKPNNYTTITRTKKVKVEAGKVVEVDMRNEDPKMRDEIFVRYVPTPNAVVDAMCKLGNVGKDDVVFDLGCGDGRIVITAVKKFGAKRGVGIDIDPERIKDSKENAKEAKVEDKVKFRMEDVLKLKDISEATVVMLYMGEDLNLAIRPILQKSLKPGSRLVSHRFTMGDWKPDKTITVKDDDGEECKLHLWTIGEKKEKE